MKEDKTNIGSQTAKERETVRQLFKGGLYTVISIIMLVAIILFLTH